MVPVTTMEEVPVLDGKEPAELLCSLKTAEAEIEAGRAAEYDPKTFARRLVRIYRGNSPQSSTTSVSTDRIVGRCWAIWLQLSPSSALAKSEPELVPK